MPYISEGVETVYDYLYYQLMMRMNNFSFHKPEAVRSVGRFQWTAGREAAGTLDKTFCNTCTEHPTQVPTRRANEQKFIDSTLFPVRKKLRISASK